MSFKPSDFFLSIVTFLGVLVPGGVFIFLCGPSIHALFPPQGSAQYWVAILIASYVVGQILLAATELLNGVAGYVAWGFPTLVRNIRRDRSHHPVQRFDGATFHEAISFVRLRSAAAASEIDRHMADYKLLRNLVAVFLIDAVWSFIDDSHRLLGAGWDGLLVLLSFFGFVRMHYWANRLALEYKKLLTDLEKTQAAAKMADATGASRG